MKEKNKKTRNNLILFTIITLSCGWLGVIIDQILTEQPEGNSLGMGIWLILPFLTALILRIKQHDFQDAGFSIHLIRDWKWYLFTIILYPIITVLMVFIAKLFGTVEIADFTWKAYWGVVLIAVPGNIIKNIFEEFSWRGYLSQKLTEYKLNDWMIYLLTGIIWSLWHAAYYLVFLPDEYFVDTSRIKMLLSGCIIMIGWSILFVEIRRLTKSVWPCVLLHTMEDAVPTVLVTIGGYITFTRGSATWFDPTFGIVSEILLVIAGLFVRNIRLKQEK